jgi:membrane associated rhomboid family serine protease
VTDQPELNADEQISDAPAQPLINLPPVVVILIGSFVAVHAALQFANQSCQVWVQYAFAFIPARFGPAPFPQIPGSAYWSMLTYAFLHADWIHLGTNSLWLAIFSKPVATRLGTIRYLILFALTVMAGAIAGLIVHWGQMVIMIGASAGVSGILAAAIPIMYGGDFHEEGEATGIMQHFRPLRPIELLTNRRALIFTIMWLGLTMITATSQYATGTAFLEERVIAWEAHLGGFFMGLIGFYLLDRKSISSPVNL